MKKSVSKVVAITNATKATRDATRAKVKEFRGAKNAVVGLLDDVASMVNSRGYEFTPVEKRAFTSLRGNLETINTSFRNAGF